MQLQFSSRSEQESNFSHSNPSVFATQDKSDWGPKRDPLLIVIIMSVVYVTIFLSGLIGNISTCIVIARNKSMHTSTNYYLFSLAISDLLLLISGLPPEIYSIWSKYPYIFGEIFCVLQGFAAETSANATVLTITAFTIERYVAICHPFLSHTLSKLSRAVKYIIVIWIVAMSLAIPQAIAFGIVCEELSSGHVVDDHCICNIKRSVIPHAFAISTFVFFMAPMSLITVLYILIGLQLHRSTVKPTRGHSVRLRHRVYKPVVTCANSSTQVSMTNGAEGSLRSKTVQSDDEGRKNFAKTAQATKHVVKMLVAVVVAFFICWAPFHAQRLLAIYGKHTSAHMIKAFQILTYISGVFYYLSTTVNPVLYHIMSNKFREAFKATYKQCCGKGHHLPGGTCYSTLSVRSSHANSHSNTDSYSQGSSSHRYLEDQMARLQDSRRPLVVSFRRKTVHSSPSSTSSFKRVIILDTKLQAALSELQVGNDGDCVGDIPVISCLANMNCSFIEVHNLQPTHICPLSSKSAMTQEDTE